MTIEMRPSFLVLLFALCICVSITSAGVFKIHSRITNPLTALFANVKPSSTDKTPDTNLGNVVDYVGYFSASDDYKPYYNTEVVHSAHTLPSVAYIGSSSIPIAPPKRGTYQYDTCGSNIVVPLTYNRKVLMEQTVRPTYKSTDFPAGRTYPLVCNWNVQVSKNCSRARITMRVDGRSRLPDEEGCAKGYIRVSPFMKEAKICGRVNYIQPYYWYVEDHKPEVVTITMKNIGLNDGYSEGFSFTLSGECLPIEIGIRKFDVDKENSGSNSRWMYRLLSDSALSGVPTVVIPGVIASPNSSLVAASSASVSHHAVKLPPVDTGHDAEMLMLIKKNQERNRTTTTTTAPSTSTSERTTVTTTATVPPTTKTTPVPRTTTTSTTKRPVPDFDLETPWHVLRPSKPAHPSASSTSAASMTTPQPTNALMPLMTGQSKPHPILSVTFPHRDPSTSTTASPTSTTTRKPTKKPLDSTFDLETPWQTLKNQSRPSLKPRLPTSTTTTPTTLTSGAPPVADPSLMVLKYNHRNQSVSTYKPNLQSSAIWPSSSPFLDVKLPVFTDVKDASVTLVARPSAPSRPSLSEIDDASDPATQDSNDLTADNQAANLPVDDIVDEALSYITSLLGNPPLQKSVPRKPGRKPLTASTIIV